MATINFDNGMTFEGTAQECFEFMQMQASEKLVSVATETSAAPAKVGKHAKQAEAPKAEAPKASKKPELTSNQRRRIDGVIARAEKCGFALKWYKQGTWVWFEDKYGKPYGERKHTRNDSEEFAGMKLATKATKCKYSKARGQFCIKDFFAA